MITDGSRLDHDHASGMILTAPSALRWKMPYAAGASGERQPMSSKFVHAERVIFSQEGA